MDACKVLVAVCQSPQEGAILLLDLQTGRFEQLLPYPGCLHATRDVLFVVRSEGDKACLAKYDRDGLCWLQRVPQCFDAHSVVAVNDGLAICATGTNEIIFLDSDGRPLRRWCADPQAEADSWHINSLCAHEGRLYATCFGCYSHFRDWKYGIDSCGMLLDVASGCTVLAGLGAPHNPRRLDGGWLLNESHHSRTVFFADGDPERQMIVTRPGFSRGLVVLPEAYVIGFSSPRDRPRGPGTAAVHVVERRSYRVQQVIDLPYREILHIAEAPADDVVCALSREEHHQRPGLARDRAAIAEQDRAGGIALLGPLRAVASAANDFEITVRVSNNGSALWSSDNELSVQVGYQFLDGSGGVLAEGAMRSRLPMPVLPGKTLTFLAAVNRKEGPAAARALRFTIAQENVGWWPDTQTWSSAAVELPAGEAAGSPRPWWRSVIGLGGSR